MLLWVMMMVVMVMVVMMKPGKLSCVTVWDHRGFFTHFI
jgi:hypothetical protein